MTTLMKNLRKRSKLSVSVAIAVVVLAFLTLVPFKFERAVGYEVAVAGVDKDLALDNDRVIALLKVLGMEDAKVDVLGCEATCSLIVRELDSQEDANLVVAAFSSGGETTLEFEVIEVLQEESGSLLEQAKCAIVLRRETYQDDCTVHKILVERLGEGCDGNAITWIQCLTDSMLFYQFGLGGVGDKTDLHVLVYCPQEREHPEEEGTGQILLHSTHTSRNIHQCQNDGVGAVFDVIGQGSVAQI